MPPGDIFNVTPLHGKLVFQTVVQDTCAQPVQRNIPNVQCTEDNDRRYTCTCPRHASYTVRSDEGTSGLIGQPSLYGRNCEFDLNECQFAKCGAGKTCVNLFGGYKCLSNNKVAEIEAYSSDERIEFTELDKQIFYQMGMGMDEDPNVYFKNTGFLVTDKQQASGAKFYGSITEYLQKLIHFESNCITRKREVSDSIKTLFETESRRVKLNKMLTNIQCVQKFCSGFEIWAF